MHLPPIPHFLVRWTIRAVLVVLFVGLPATLWYLREVGVGVELKELVAKALSGEAFQTAIGRLSFDPFKGLVAEHVEVVETGDNKRNLARIERLVVSINLSDLVSRKISIDHIELDDTDVAVPLDAEPNGARLILKGVSAQCVFFPEQIRISFFEGNVQGVRVVLNGVLQNPQAFHPEHHAAPPGSAAKGNPAGSIVKKLSELKFPGAQPELHAEINGDLADLSSLQISSIVLRSGPVIAPKWRVEGLEATAEYEKGNLTVGQFLVRGREGALNASAQWQNGALEFELSSSLLPEPFLSLLPKNATLESLKFKEAPRIEAAGRATFSSSPAAFDVTGSVSLGKFAFRGVNFDSFSTDFAFRDGKVFARDARLIAGGGEIKADVFLAPEDFRLRLTNTIVPTVFIPMLGPNEQAFLKMMEFRDPPYVQLDVRGTKPDLAVLKGTGFLRIGRTAMRGSWLDWGQSKLEIADRAVTYRDFSLGRGKGEGSGTFVYDFGGQQVLLHKINSTMPPVDVLMWVDPKIAEAIKPYRFRQPPKVRGEGMIHMSDAKQNNLALQIESAEGLDYDLLKRTLKFGRTLADVQVKGTKVNADVKSAELMGGEVSIKAVVSIDASDPTFGADLTMRRVNFARLTKLYFDFDTSKGLVSGKFKFNARMDQEEEMRGNGSIRVEDGQVFAIPILGPLSPIINRIIPGAGLHAASLATADFRIQEQKILTDNLVIEGAGFSLYGNGDIFFMKDKMDMSVRINARGLPGLVLFPVSKLFEYVSTGSVSEPEWRAKIIPRFGNGESKEGAPRVP